VHHAHAVVDELGAGPLRGQLEALARRARIDLRPQHAAEAAPNPALERLELTPREVDLPALLAGGLTNREIGTELFITNKTRASTDHGS
jgi:DNA-binding NarL/FixJ family response regulator